MRQLQVYCKGALAGILVEEDDRSHRFSYDKDYLAEIDRAAISLSLPKRADAYIARELFPFFQNMVAEGVNRKLQCQRLRIDENDLFGLLMHTAQFDTIGAITVKPVSDD